jgi:environmental stress-induced protein Ves
MDDPICRMVSADRLKVAPWKNGGGTTTEFGRGAPRGGGQDWSWRVSAATVDANGPFSAFPGIDRTICAIEGNGMDLRFADGLVIPLELDQPVKFDGGDAVEGRLRENAIRDFNIMVDRRYYRSTLDIISGVNSVSRKMSHKDVFLIHTLAGHCMVAAGKKIEKSVRLNETMILEGATGLSVDVTHAARVALVMLESI